MGNVTIFAVFIVLIASFAISVHTARSRSSDRLQDFLFTGNTPLLALSSCIGSIISMAVSFTALLSAGYEWGWQIVFSMIAGCAAGLAAILKLTEHPKIKQNEPRIEQRQFVYGASYLATLGSRSSMSFYTFMIVSYGAMLLTEIVILRVFIAFLTELPAAELFLTVATVLLVCYGYVYIGGFRGVLVTDYFQLLVVFTFVGLWFASISPRTVLHAPSAITAHTGFNALTRTLLHVGVFAGTFAWIFAGIDQWYRTVGTLPLRTAKRVLTSSAIALSAFSIVPVLAGAAAVGRPDIPSGVTNGVSMVLIASLLTHANTTVRFVFAMALTCAALTTLNTYLMTMQQLYYEASTRIDSTHWLHYLLIKYPLKWKEIRGFVAVLTVIAFACSCFFPGRYVYAFGVLALSTFILMLPFVTGALAEIYSESSSQFVRAVAGVVSRAMMTRGGLAVSAGLLGWLGFLVAARTRFGSLSDHLYLIPAAAFGAALLAIIVTVVVSKTSQEERANA